MRKTLVFPLLFVISLLTIFLSYKLSHAGYLITLKNGRTITVSDYRDTGDQISFYSQGGEMAISKQAVQDIKRVELNETENLIYKYKEESVETTPGIEVGTARSQEEDKTSKFSDLIGELADLYRQREALAKERERLVKKQEELTRDIRQEGTRILPTKKKEFERQLNALEDEIKEFNEKIADIEKREKTIKSKIESFE